MSKLKEVALLGLLAMATSCSESPQRMYKDAAMDGRRVDWRLPFKWPEAGDLVGTDHTPAGSDRCVGATQLTFSKATVTVNGSTQGASNEHGNAIRCGEVTALSGPQRYFKIGLTQGRTYQIILSPKFTAALYVFSECSRSIMNVDCSSEGATGVFSGAVAAQGTKTVYFSPPATGTYYLAVDSTSSTLAGTFELKVTELSTPSNDACTKAQALQLSSGKVSVKATTAAASNEFTTQIGCGLGLDFDGPQIYYSVALTAGTWYRFTLLAEYNAAFYVFSQQAGCKAANIETDCSGLTGTVLPLVPQGKSAAVAFKPLTSGTHLVAVDSLSAKAWGDFALTIETFTPPGGMDCAAATSLTLVGGQASVQGSTAGLLNDRGALVACGSVPPLLGPQTYYTVSLEQKTYQVALKPAFSAVLAIGSSCSTLPADCGTAGFLGDVLQVSSGSSGSLLFKAPSAGAYILAIDSATTSASGTFGLTVQEHTKPTNGSCNVPKALALTASPVLEVGDTGSLTNDLANVSCGLTAGPFNGPQAYYKVSLLSGKTYTVKLDPEATFDPSLYAFAASTTCTAQAVDKACTGAASDNVGAGITETLTLVPTVATDLILVVDSWSASEVGTYTLSLSWK